METPAAIGDAVQYSRGLLGDQVQKQVGALGTRLERAADGLRLASQHLRSNDEKVGSDLTDGLASYLERSASYLQSSDLERLVADADDIASRAPLAFTTAALFGGIALARFLRASNTSVATRDDVSYASDSPPPSTRSRKKRKSSNGHVAPKGVKL